MMLDDNVHTKFFFKRCVETRQRHYKTCCFQPTRGPHIPRHSDSIPIFILLNVFLESSHCSRTPVLFGKLFIKENLLDFDSANSTKNRFNSNESSIKSNQYFPI